MGGQDLRWMRLWLVALWRLVLAGVAALLWVLMTHAVGG